MINKHLEQTPVYAMHNMHCTGKSEGWASECPDVKNYKWRLNPVWHRML